MSGKLGYRLGALTLILGLVLPAAAQLQPSSITGYVRNLAGIPQMGAVVEVLGSAAASRRAFTNENGFYSIAGLVPGIYSLRVSAPSFLPALQERIGLTAGGTAVVNITLNTLFEAIQLGPRRGPADEGDWKWVLRSSANRPILRMLSNDPQVAAADEGQKSEDGNDDHQLKAVVSFLAGSPSEGFGSTSDMSTGFSLEKQIFSAGTLGLGGSVGYGDGSPGGILRASYRHMLANGSEPQVTVTMRRLEAPDINLRSATFQSLALTTTDSFTFGDVVELHFGSELQTIQFLGSVTAFSPFGSADLHLSPDTVLEYRYASSRPNTGLDQGFDTAPADLSEPGARVSMAQFAATIEHAHHNELSISHRVGSGKTQLQLAAYSDRVTDPALTGVGTLSAEGGEVLPDIYSGTFTYRGRGLDTEGMRLVLQRKLASDLTATVDYSYGGVLDLARPNDNLQDARQNMQVHDRHAVAGKVNGTLPRAKTHWVASYRWTSGPALTPVDWFNASPGQAEPYLNILVRQPIPGTGFLPCHMEAVVELRNLLAQGYVPVMGQDGRTVYLVQAARSVRGGVAFTF